VEAVSRKRESIRHLSISQEDDLTFPDRRVADGEPYTLQTAIHVRLTPLRGPWKLTVIKEHNGKCELILDEPPELWVIVLRKLEMTLIKLADEL
jgi:hypothetical protein